MTASREFLIAGITAVVILSAALVGVQVLRNMRECKIEPVRVKPLSGGSGAVLVGPPVTVEPGRTYNVIVGGSGGGGHVGTSPYTGDGGPATGGGFDPRGGNGGPAR